MSLILNKPALEHALQLSQEAQFRLNTVWERNRPTDTAAQQFIEKHGLEQYANWHLAIDPALPADDAARYQLPYGDFKSVHYSGVRSIKTAAEREGQVELRDAADEILDLLDRFNAC